MTYSETLNYLYANLPMFQRVGAAAYKKDLTNTLQLCEALGNPHLKFKSIHIAGTNGKGSSSHMLAAIVQTAGYKTGLYTSPHLKEFTERIRVNGKEIDQEFIIDFVERITPAIERIQPSFFEITVAMAFDYFVKEKVDIAVIETGLGGRLDSTNVITPLVSLITNISWDHKDLLGDTLKKIAFEKAGIIKPGVPVIISERQPHVEEVFESKARECISELVFASDLYQVNRIPGGTYEVIHDRQTSTYELDLLGIYQAKNLKGVLAAISELRKQGFRISSDHVNAGLKNTTTLTDLKGRWQKIGDNPLTICDTGHNEAGIKEILCQVKEIRFNKLHWVLGMVKDKDVTTILHLLPKDANYYFCQASIPRAMPAGELQEKALEAGLRGVAISNVNAAINHARANSTPTDLILIGGSTFVVAEIENL
ncbi:MAG: folylpolyglutamate synthase/dihydrofolate synthase family protein [Cyclobacteriaceae bacterium]